MPVTENQTNPPNDAAEKTLADPRESRIEQFSRESLLDPDPLSALLGAAIGDLFKLQWRLREALDESLLDARGTLEDLQDAMPAVATYSKVTQQAERLTQLSLKLKASQAGG